LVRLVRHQVVNPAQSAISLGILHFSKGSQH